MVSDGYNSQTSAFEVTKIDPLVPEINEITISDLDYNQARLNIDAKDVGEDSERSEIQGYIYDCGNGISSDLTTETSYLCSNLEKETDMKWALRFMTMLEILSNKRFLLQPCQNMKGLLFLSHQWKQKKWWIYHN